MMMICYFMILGTGKSTLASLLADRLRITTVISTDAVRHMLCDNQDGILSKSTYECGEYEPIEGMTHNQRVRQVRNFTLSETHHQL